MAKRFDRRMPVIPGALLGGYVSNAMIVAQRASLTTPATTVTVANAKGWRAQWLAERQAELLPVPYFQVDFTLPAAVGEIAFQNKAVVYAILFRAAAETLATIAADLRHLMVLHTWRQTLQYHPHVHSVVPGGGPSLDDSRWVAVAPASSCRCACSRGCSADCSCGNCRTASAASKLRFFGKLANFAKPQAFARRLGELRRRGCQKECVSRSL